jgi:hypothetical protein
MMFNEDYRRSSHPPGFGFLDPPPIDRNHPFHVTNIVITGYRCPGCTIHFEDPVLFCQVKPLRIVFPMATKKPPFPGLELTETALEALAQLKQAPEVEASA